ncbi:MAG TPA: hypothetical protein VFQ61_30465, partial [Polyangiaceae bacterium]|nr:hypothetical protein [Polyangiaceae bacterium]
MQTELNRSYSHPGRIWPVLVLAGIAIACSSEGEGAAQSDSPRDEESSIDPEEYLRAEREAITSDTGIPVSISNPEETVNPAAAAVIPHGACLDGITNFSSAGPFAVSTQRSGPVNFYVPGVPSGCKVPVVHLANGTGATCATYGATLRRLASHGFLAACYESTNTGAGDQGLEALDRALSAFPNLADNKFGSTGHSQGGQAAFTVLALAEKKYGERFIYAGLAMQPASGFGAQPRGTTWRALYGSIRSPMFMFSGLGSDGLVSQSWVQSAYNATNAQEEAYFWAKSGSRHIPVPNSETQQVAVPWFRWKL